MRLALVATAVALIAAGGVGGHYVTSAEKLDNGFSQKYLSLVNSNPDEISRYISASMTNCLPPVARTYVGDPVVNDLATKTFLKSIVLMAEGKSPEQSSTEFIPWIIKQAEGASKQQQQDYISLAKNGLTNPDTMSCVMFTVKQSIDQRIDIAAGWDLRS